MMMMMERMGIVLWDVWTVLCVPLHEWIPLMLSVEHKCILFECSWKGQEFL